MWTTLKNLTLDEKCMSVNASTTINDPNKPYNI